MASGTSVLAAMWALATIQLVAVGIRIWIVLTYRRQQHGTSWHLSDSFITFSLVLNYAIIILDTWMVRNFENTAPGLDAVKKKIDFAIAYLYFFALYAIKASLLALYFRVAHKLVLKTWVKVTLWSTVAILTATFIVTLAENFFPCWPLWRNWSSGPDYCTAALKMWTQYLFIVMTLFTDILVMAVPFSFILQLPDIRRYWIALATVLGIGCVSIIASIVRFTSVLAASKGNFSPEEGFLNGTLWAVVEDTAGLIAACLPSYRELWKRKKAASRGTGNSGSYPTVGSGGGFRSRGKSVPEDSVLLTQLEAREEGETRPSF